MLAVFEAAAAVMTSVYMIDNIIILLCDNSWITSGAFRVYIFIKSVVACDVSKL